MKTAIIVAAVVAAFSTGTSVLADSGKPPLNGHFHNGKPSLTILRRHQALGRLPGVVPSTAAQSKLKGNATGSFDWSDAAIGLGAGIALMGLGVALGGHLRRRPAHGVLAAGSVVTVGLALAAVAAATPPSKTVGTFLARGTSAEALSFDIPREVTVTKKIKVRIKGKLRTRVVREQRTVKDPIIACSQSVQCDAVVQTIDFPPGASTGWHSHPGALVVVVKAGTVTRYEHDCMRSDYSAGQAFVERGATHLVLVRNEGSAPAQVYVTYLVPAGTSNADLRLDHAAPANCPVG